MTGPARGSKLQMRLYVNQHRDKLDAAILPLLDGAARLEWRAPLPPSFTEPRDAAFLRALRLEHLAPSLAEFWPRRGPVWDALAIVALEDGRSGALLVEAKSYPGEVYSGGCGAIEPAREKIEQALFETQAGLGLNADAGRWMDSLRPDKPGHSSVYQSANRYAHLLWLRRQGIEAWLVHLLVVEDPTFRSTTRAQWEDALPRIARDLGVEGITVPGALHVYVDGLVAPS